MKKLLLVAICILSMLQASIIDGVWHNSSSVGRGELKELKINGSMMQPYIKSRHRLTPLRANIALGRGSVKSSAWKLGNGLIMILAQYSGNGKLYVEVAQTLYNNYNPKIHRYIFTKGPSHSHKFPFRGEWINADPFETTTLYKLKIKRKNGHIRIKAWRRCADKKCLLAKATARQFGNRLYATMYDGRVRINTVIQGEDYNPAKKRYEKLRADISVNIDGRVNRHTIYLFRKHH